MSDNTENILTIEILPSLAGERADKALAALLPDLSRTRIKALMLAGLVEADGELAGDPAAAVTEGEVYIVTVPAPDDPVLRGEDIKLDVLFEDDEVIVVNKPAGLVVHPAPGNYSGTLVNALIHHCGQSLSGIGGVRRPGIVHRLDKDTSGVMVAAKTDAAHRGLAEQFHEHTITRKYAAVALGCPRPLTGTVKTLIARHPKNRKKMAVSDKRGKEAVTFYNVKDVFNDAASLVECTLKTGRTHQVRVHMAHLGHPIVGDATYGRGKVPKSLQGTEAGDAVRDFPRQALHAAHLGLKHPKTGEWLDFDCPLPMDMEKLIKILKT